MARTLLRRNSLFLVTGGVLSLGVSAVDTLLMLLLCDRYKPWPKVHAFLESLPRYSLVVDVGCGNGKYLRSLPRSQPSPFFSALSPSDPCTTSSFVGLPSSPSPARSSSSPCPSPSPSSSSSSSSSSIPSASVAGAAGSEPGECLVIGVDISTPLLEIACQRANACGRVVAATCLNTNLREGQSSSVLQSVSEVLRRMQARGNPRTHHTGHVNLHLHRSGVRADRAQTW